MVTVVTCAFLMVCPCTSRSWNDLLAAKAENTEVAMCGRDVVTLEEVSDGHIRSEFVVMLVFEACQSFSSNINATMTFNADTILKDSVPES